MAKENGPKPNDNPALPVATGSRCWRYITAAEPADGATVETKIDGDGRGCRNVATLKRSGNLWFFADESMYVYYEPTHWRPLG